MDNAKRDEILIELHGEVRAINTKLDALTAEEGPLPVTARRLNDHAGRLKSLEESRVRARVIISFILLILGAIGWDGAAAMIRAKFGG